MELVPFKDSGGCLKVFGHKLVQRIASINGPKCYINNGRHAKPQQDHGKPQHRQCPSFWIQVSIDYKKMKCNSCYSESVAPLFFQRWYSFQKSKDCTTQHYTEDLHSHKYRSIHLKTDPGELMHSNTNS